MEQPPELARLIGRSCNRAPAHLIHLTRVSLFVHIVNASPIYPHISWIYRANVISCC